MPKKTSKQKPIPASSVIVKEPLPCAASRKTAATGSGVKRTTRQSKSDRVLSPLKQAGGATLDELMKATSWQAHSVRGFLSGSVRKQKGLTVLSECDGAGSGDTGSRRGRRPSPMVKAVSVERVAAEMAALSGLPRERLVELWEQRFRTSPPRSYGRPLLELAAAYVIQERALGALKAATRRPLDTCITPDGWGTGPPSLCSVPAIPGAG